MNIVSFSGGKDSTAMLLKMIELGYDIDVVIFADTGMEFPEMYEHIDKVEAQLDIEITRVKSPKTYKYYLADHEIRPGKVGYGHPDFRNRWCTRVLKKLPIMRFVKRLRVEATEFMGFSTDEIKRADNLKKDDKRELRFPLIEWGMSGADNLAYCYSRGFDWGGLYTNFDRASCWCCPLSRMGEMRAIYNHYPNLWSELGELDKVSNRRLLSRYTYGQLTKKFEDEAKEDLNGNKR